MDFDMRFSFVFRRKIRSEWKKCEGFFSSNWYQREYSLKISRPIYLFEHFYNLGWRMGYNPNFRFETDWYLNENPDVKESGINPLIHYVDFGRYEGRWPSPNFDPKFYAQCYMNEPEPNTALPHLLQSGISIETPQRVQVLEAVWDEGQHIGPIDGKAWYRTRFPDRKSHEEVTICGLLNYIESKGLPRIEADSFKKIEREWVSSGRLPGKVIATKLNNCAILTGSSTILPEPGVAINDEIFRTSKVYEGPSLVKDYGNVEWCNGKLKIGISGSPTPRIKSGIHLFKEHDRNYFHSIVELVSKLNMLEEDLSIPEACPILLCDDLPKSVVEAVYICKNPKRPILPLKRHHIYRVENLYYCSDICHILDAYDRVPELEDAFIPEEQMQKLSRRICDSFGKSVINSDRMIYIKRGSSYRCVVNESDIIDLLISFGFEIIDLNELSLRAQVEIFKSAKFIVAPTGASLTNLLWCNQGVKAIILYPNHPYSNKSFWQRIAKIKKIKMSFIYGRRQGDINGTQAPHDNYEIIPSILKKEIDQMGV